MIHNPKPELGSKYNNMRRQVLERNMHAIMMRAYSNTCTKCGDEYFGPKMDQGYVCPNCLTK